MMLVLSYAFCLIGGAVLGAASICMLVVAKESDEAAWAAAMQPRASEDPEEVLP